MFLKSWDAVVAFLKISNAVIVFSTIYFTFIIQNSVELRVFKAELYSAEALMSKAFNLASFNGN